MGWEKSGVSSWNAKARIMRAMKKMRGEKALIQD
jgi:hypothetical protein